MIQFVLKEASLLIAFIVLGAILLVCVWITQNVNTSVMKEFKNAQISVVLKEGGEEKFKTLIEKNPNVLRYEYFTAEKNRERLGSLYPELKNVIAPLESRFFPASVVVSVADPGSFLAELNRTPELFESQILHQPPVKLQELLNTLTFIFSGLWLLTLTLILYFNLERLMVREEPKWSLMKMLGAKPYRIFIPLLSGQNLRIVLAIFFAALVFSFLSSELRAFFAWNWENLAPSVWINFIAISLGLTSLISFTLFATKYRKVSIG